MAIVGNGFDINKKSLTRGSNGRKKKLKKNFLFVKLYSLRVFCVNIFN